MKKYIPSQIEPKWQQKWKEEKLFSPDLDQAPKPFFNLMMFPYPSAEGLHVGNMYPFTGSDIFGRFKRMRGFDVFEPIGLDGFGIHSENYALQTNQHPMDLSKVTEKRFYEQLTMIGDAYDWDHTVETYKPNYYKWTQWIFLQMFKKGLAYRKKASVNWCPKDKTVLSDEQVVNGLCERCSSKVEQKELEQWFFKITDYADRLLENLKTIDWSEKVKLIQKNWIGKSEGVLLKFKSENGKDEAEVFTTALDTVFGVTFLVISPENPLLANFVTQQQKQSVDEYVQLARKKSELERKENKEKTGIFTGGFVINPFNGEKVPVWVADYVLAGYGTGAVMGVPGHDARDYEFAKKWGLEIKPVIKPKDGVTGANIEEDGFWDYAEEIKNLFAEKSTLFNSGEYSGLNSKEAKEKMSGFMESNKLGSRQTQYHLRDWLISRQRYWGPPIPIIYCDKCGTVPVPEKDLPVELPNVPEFRPTGTGESPLSSVPNFYNVACPQCGGQARRETDVSDTFLDSAWYFLRYPSTEFTEVPIDQGRTKKWLPVDMYIGGAEHAVLHLLYSRFITMVLKDLGYLEFEEPYKTFFAHGLIIKDGAKMSKSKGNVINPDKYIKEYGADTLRVYLMFMGPLSEGGDFRDGGMNGVYRFLQRIWGLQEKLKVPRPRSAKRGGQSAKLKVEDSRVMHKTIKKVTEDIEQLKFNTAIASLMEWLNHLSRRESVSEDEYRTLLKLLAPFAPHITEELYQYISGSEKLTHRHTETPTNWSIHQQSWPEFDKNQLEEEEIAVAVQVNGKVRDVLLIQKDLLGNREVVEKMAKESQKVQKFLAGKFVKKSVYVPGKIVSLVVSS